MLNDKSVVGSNPRLCRPVFCWASNQDFAPQVQNTDLDVCIFRITNKVVKIPQTTENKYGRTVRSHRHGRLQKLSRQKTTGQ